MITIIGNILIVIAAFLFIGLTTTLYGKGAPGGGDAAVSYYWGIIIYNLAILICLALLAISIGWQGGWDWVASTKSAQFIWVGSSLCIIAMGNALCGLFLHEHGPHNDVIRLLSQFVPLVIPLVLLFASIILINESIRKAVPIEVYSRPIWAVLALSALSIGAFAFDLFSESAKNDTRKIEELNERAQAIHLQHLVDIEACDVYKNMVSILVLTDIT